MSYCNMISLFYVVIVIVTCFDSCEPVEMALNSDDFQPDIATNYDLRKRSVRQDQFHAGYQLQPVLSTTRGRNDCGNHLKERLSSHY